MIIRSYYKRILAIFFTLIFSVNLAFSSDLYDDLYTLNLLNSSYCQGNGGKWTGMSCDRRQSHSGNGVNVIDAIIGVAILAAIFGTGKSKRSGKKEYERPSEKLRYDDPLLYKAFYALPGLKKNKEQKIIADKISSFISNKVIRYSSWSKNKFRFFSLLEGGYYVLLYPDKRHMSQDLELEITTRKLRRPNFGGTAELDDRWSIEFISKIPHLCISMIGDGIIRCDALEFRKGPSGPIVNVVSNSNFLFSEDDKTVARFDNKMKEHDIIYAKSYINSKKYSFFAEKYSVVADVVAGVQFANQNYHECYKKHEGECLPQLKNARRWYDKLAESFKWYDSELAKVELNLY